MWTVPLTVEIKVRLKISLALCGQGVNSSQGLGFMINDLFFLLVFLFLDVVMKAAFNLICLEESLDLL